MSKKKIGILAGLLVIIVLLNIAIMKRQSPGEGNLDLHLEMTAEDQTEVQVYYGNSLKFEENKSAKEECGEGKTDLTFQINSKSEYLRVDLGKKPAEFLISDAYVQYKDSKMPLELGRELSSYEKTSLIRSYEASEEGVHIVTGGKDPYLVLKVDLGDLQEAYMANTHKKDLIVNIILILLLDAACVVVWKLRKKISVLPLELYRNRQLILNLAKNDFKTKYAGSYLGIVWAFIQPIITVLVYWFVFQVGLGATGVVTRKGIEAPFVLWLLAGLVPWFFFQDALFGGTNALIEYNYLVKKVVFKISVLPIVKIISALFVHVFFVGFMLVLYTCYGYTPDFYSLQVVYYTFCMFILVLGICYATCAIVGFFRDLTQIINIVLQVGVWMTPIMWNIDAMPLSPILINILKLNPMFYVVNGYRDAMLNKVWFWEHPNLTLEFWGVAIVLFVLGSVIFKRLKVHFADVL